MARHKSFEKEDVLIEATNLFWKQGFEKTSIQELVNTTGINRASLYHAFNGKKELFQTCLIEYRDEVISTINNLFNKEKTIKRGFESLYDFIIKSLSDDPDKKGCFICNTYAEFLPSNNHVDYQIIHETRDIWISTLQKYLNKGKENGEITSNTNTIQKSYAIYASIIGIGVLSKTNTNKRELKNIFKSHLNIFN